jgi:hypothetical protein
VIKTADWIIDRWPESLARSRSRRGNGGGEKACPWLDPRIVAWTPEDVVREPDYTGRRFLKEMLQRRPANAKRLRGAAEEATA